MLFILGANSGRYHLHLSVFLYILNPFAIKTYSVCIDAALLGPHLFLSLKPTPTPNPNYIEPAE